MFFLYIKSNFHTNFSLEQIYQVEFVTFYCSNESDTHNDRVTYRCSHDFRMVTFFFCISKSKCLQFNRTNHFYFCFCPFINFRKPIQIDEMRLKRHVTADLVSVYQQYSQIQTKNFFLIFHVALDASSNRNGIYENLYRFYRISFSL